MRVGACGRMQEMCAEQRREMREEMRAEGGVNVYARCEDDGKEVCSPVLMWQRRLRPVSLRVQLFDVPRPSSAYHTARSSPARTTHLEEQSVLEPRS